MINQQLSGINAVITFTVNIFQSSGSTINPNYATMIIGSILLVATVLSSFIVNHVGRRPTLLFTQVIMTLSLMVFGMFFYLKTYSPAHAEALSWLPITTLVIFIVTFSFGLGKTNW